MKLVLILMIKNESKILRRCLEAVSNIVDGFCICDTGSTDNSVEIAEEFLKDKVGNVSVEPWRNFGHNRTMSFVNARKYISGIGWDLKEVYGLLLDADMVFVPGKIREQNLTEIGYKIIQKNGGLVYHNCRFIRFDYDWKCLGVTHEYWSGPVVDLPESVCFIDDRNDGGCKHDKFERDIKLLEQGLVDEPDNVRYMFYLAQTLKCIGKFSESIKFYKKRIRAGGWDEELWHSYYSIGDCWKHLGDLIKFEEYMQKAYKFRPCRTETIYKLAEHYRIVGEHYKAYHYIQIGLKTPFPKNDVLFIENGVYNGLFDYEASIVDYYIHPDRGLKSSMTALIKTEHMQQNIVSNLKFYVKPIPAVIEPLTLPSPFGPNFTPSAISLDTYPMANVRYVNYLPPVDGNYRTRDGSSIQTKNAYINLETGECSPFMTELPVPYESYVKGLEDLRLYRKNDKLYFTATSCREYIENKVCIVHGEYDVENKSYDNIAPIQSPINSDCEKNWVNIPGTDDFIYSWHPLRIGKIREDKFYFSKEIETPPVFSLFRGSATPILIDNVWWTLVHFVEYCQPRKYYHCIVQLEQKSFKVLKVSLPFVFKELGIEFCISVKTAGENLEFYSSFTDTCPSKVIAPKTNFEWIPVSYNSQVISKILRIPTNVVTYWDGDYSKCLARGDIELYVEKYLRDNNKTSSAVFTTTDGIVADNEYLRLLEEFGKVPGKLTTYDKHNIDDNLIVTALCTRGVSKPNIVLVPFDDKTFTVGLTKLLETFNIPAWKSKRSVAFWRGGSSGYDKPYSIRMSVVKKLLNNGHSDVKLTKWGNWESEHNVPEEFFGERCGLIKHFLYKYILIVDGACIASNHQWIFGSGSVPIMITHPDNNWWFKKFLVPMKHYVPIMYDLSDLEEKLEWLVENDEKAEEIAANAIQFAKDYLSSEFQKTYINNELSRFN